MVAKENLRLAAMGLARLPWGFLVVCFDQKQDVVLLIGEDGTAFRKQVSFAL